MVKRKKRDDPQHRQPRQVPDNRRYRNRKRYR